MAKRKPKKTAKTKSAKAPVIPAWLQEAIDEQRGEMGKVAAMLGSLTLALAAVDDLFSETPYFPDVAEAAQEKLDRIIDSLDGINLERRRDGTSSTNGED
jgi:hypothetical protein